MRFLHTQVANRAAPLFIRGDFDTVQPAKRARTINIAHENCGRGFAAFPILVLAAYVVLAIGSVQAADSKKPPAKPRPFTVNDKTLVAWVYLGNTTQRAGSVLTLIDDEERFDWVGGRATRG